MAASPGIPIGVRSALTLTLASVVGVLVFAWPLVIRPGTLLGHEAGTPIVLGAVLLGVMFIVFIDLGRGGTDARVIALLGLLSAVGAVLRPLSAGSAGIEFVFFFIVLGGRVFGPGFGFALGSTTLFASAFLTGGLGPWLPYQMLAASWIGMGAGLLPRRLRGRPELVLVAGYAGMCGFLYGQAMNLSFWPFTIGPNTALSFVLGAPLTENVQHFLLFSLTTSLGWDVMRAVVLAAGVAIIGAPTLKALRRSARKATFAAPESTVTAGR